MQQNDIEYLEVEESSFLCSKCLIQMHKLILKDITLNVCLRCKMIMTTKEDFDKVIQHSLRKGRFV